MRSQANNPATPASFAQPPGQQRGTTFQYVGKTALTAIGPVSGRRYRFSCFGQVLDVDPRDVMSFAVVPNLRQIRSR
jgi:hypothetical protein